MRRCLQRVQKIPPHRPRIQLADNESMLTRRSACPQGLENIPVSPAIGIEESIWRSNTYSNAPSFPHFAPSTQASRSLLMRSGSEGDFCAAKAPQVYQRLADSQASPLVRARCPAMIPSNSIRMTLWKTILTYDGTWFHGWQIQPGLATIQAALAQAILHVTGESVLPQGSGRTDTGVHPLG